METIIWIFEKVMPWIGAWFTVMTVIFLLFTICYTFKIRKFGYYDITELGFEEPSIIVLFVPMVLLACMALTVVGISRTPSLVRKIRNRISNINSIAK